MTIKVSFMFSNKTTNGKKGNDVSGIDVTPSFVDLDFGALRSLLCPFGFPEKKHTNFGSCGD